VIPSVPSCSRSASDNCSTSTSTLESERLILANLDDIYILSNDPNALERV
jgi:hypothetical protein